MGVDVRQTFYIGRCISMCKDVLATCRSPPRWRFLARTQLTLRATRPTPHVALGASRKQMPVLLVKTQRARTVPALYGCGGLVCRMTAAMHDMSTPPPPHLPSLQDVQLHPIPRLLRETIVNRIYGTHKNLYIPLSLLTTFASIYYGPP